MTNTAKNGEDRHITHPEDFKSMTDEQIIREHGDMPEATDYILYKYKGYVRSMARRYYLIGGDCDDLIQEGMIGLYKAVRDFDAQKNVSFRTFAELCIMRQMITAIKAANRIKHQPLNSFVSLNRPVFEEDCEKTLEEILPDESAMSPEDIYIENERFMGVRTKIHDNLSDFENSVMDLYLEGKSYAEISVRLNKPKKSIDNALQRAKAKLAKLKINETDDLKS